MCVCGGGVGGCVCGNIKKRNLSVSMVYFIAYGGVLLFANPAKVLVSLHRTNVEQLKAYIVLLSWAFLCWRTSERTFLVTWCMVCPIINNPFIWRVPFKQFRVGIVLYVHALGLLYN